MRYIHQKVKCISAPWLEREITIIEYGKKDSAILKFCGCDEAYCGDESCQKCGENALNELRNN